MPTVYANQRQKNWKRSLNQRNLTNDLIERYSVKLLLVLNTVFVRLVQNVLFKFNHDSSKKILQLDGQVRQF